MDGIPLDNLDQETLSKIGVVIPPSLGDIATNLSALGKVFNAIKGLPDEEALQVLRQAQMYIITRQQKQDIEAIGLPGDGLGTDYAPPISWTLQVVAKVFKLKAVDLKRRNRDAKVAEARQVAMYVLCMTTQYSLTYIGQEIGGRSPATISHGFTHISERIKSDLELKQRVDRIQELLAGK